LIGAHDLSGDAGDEPTSRALGEEALALGRMLGNDWAVAYVHMGLGLGFAMEDEFAAARALLEESVRGFTKLGDEHWEMQASRRLARRTKSLATSSERARSRRGTSAARGRSVVRRRSVRGPQGARGAMDHQDERPNARVDRLGGRGGATAARASEEGRKLTVDQAVTLALDALRSS
jgi:hypothetical protein